MYNFFSTGPKNKLASADHISFDFWSLFFCAKWLECVHVSKCLNSEALPSVKVPFFINKSKKPGMARHPRRKYTGSLLGVFFSFFFFFFFLKKCLGGQPTWLLYLLFTLLGYFIVISSPLVLILLHPLFHFFFFSRLLLYVKMWTFVH